MLGVPQHRIDGNALRRTEGPNRAHSAGRMTITERGSAYRHVSGCYDRRSASVRPLMVSRTARTTQCRGLSSGAGPPMPFRSTSSQIFSPSIRFTCGVVSVAALRAACENDPSVTNTARSAPFDAASRWNRATSLRSMLDRERSGLYRLICTATLSASTSLTGASPKAEGRVGLRCSTRAAPAAPVTVR